MGHFAWWGPLIGCLLVLSSVLALCAGNKPDDFLNRPNVVRDTGGHRGSDARRLVDAALLFELVQGNTALTEGTRGEEKERA